MTRDAIPHANISGRPVVVVGAGMVGVCVALDLLRRGAKVTLVDQTAPGSETSYGNAGVLARSSLMPLNNPAMLRDLLGLVGHRRAGFRYNTHFVVQNLRWAAQFLFNAKSTRMVETAVALDALIRLSIPAHKHMISECGQDDLLSEHGWIFLYRSQASFARAGFLRRVLSRFDVPMEQLNTDRLRDLEPSLAPIFPRGLWVQDSASVRDPGALVKAYAQRFVAEGGDLRVCRVVGLDMGDRPGVTLETGETLTPSHCVLCPGPWGRELLERAGYRVPMAYERGYHRHFCGPEAAGNMHTLGRPIYDTAGGYVLSPMRQGLRLTTGVELAGLNDRQNFDQLERAEISARQALDLGKPCDEPAWMGARPTFPDSRPCIGPLSHAPGFSVAFGHQHIGFATGPGTAQLLGDMLTGRTPPIDPAPFRPERFITRH